MMKNKVLHYEQQHLLWLWLPNNFCDKPSFRLLSELRIIKVLIVRAEIKLWNLFALKLLIPKIWRESSYAVSVPCLFCKGAVTVREMSGVGQLVIRIIWNPEQAHPGYTWIHKKVMFIIPVSYCRKSRASYLVWLEMWLNCAARCVLWEAVGQTAYWSVVLLFLPLSSVTLGPF